MKPIRARFPTLLSVFLATALCAASAISAEMHVQSTLDSRIVLAFRVNSAAVQGLIPAPWQVAPVASGPAKDANLVVTFFDRLLDQNAEGKPVNVPTYRGVAFGVPANNPQTGESGPLLVRIFNSSPDGIPGFYKTGVLATVTRSLSLSGSGREPGTAKERWTMKDGKGGAIDLQIEYQRSTPTRAKAEAKPRSGSDPAIWRIYRIDQSVDVLKSIPTGTDRTKNYKLRVAVPEFAKLFDGKEQLVSVTSVPWYTRQTFLPQP